MSLSEMNEIPTFLQIRAAKSIQLEALAKIANVCVEDIYYLEAGCPYPHVFIEKVLQALFELTGKNYTLETLGGIYTNE